ncbi:hypothetical protein QL815_002076 [Escherichia coli]|nr:hypothetical protein [Escherichia coli]
MNKVAQYYRELVASLSERLRNGERDIDALVEQARERVIKTATVLNDKIKEIPNGMTYPILRSS